MKEKSALDNSLEVINSRWPDIYRALVVSNVDQYRVEVDLYTLMLDEVRLTSRYDRTSEASLQATRIPSGSRRAFVYGPGLGDLVELLLQRKSLKEIHVIILNKVVFLHSLNIREQSGWLKNERVHLYFFETVKDVFHPFCVNPAELVLAEESAAKLRDRLELELNQEFIQERHIGQGASVQEIIKKNLDFLENDCDLEELEIEKTEEIFIAAAGPTLEDHLEWLSVNQPFIIALDAAVHVLIKNRIYPKIIVSIDPVVYQLFEDIPRDELKNIPLVYFPSVDRRLLEMWPGTRFYSYSETAMFENLPDKYKRQSLFGAGSVIHPAVDLAVYLDARKIVLLGADFSFTYNKSHASDKSSKKSLIDPQRARHWVLNSIGEKVSTTPNFKGYLRDLERYIERTPHAEFYNGSLLGARIDGTSSWKH